MRNIRPTKYDSHTTHLCDNMSSPKFDEIIVETESIRSCVDEIRKIISGEYEGSKYVAFRYNDLDGIADIRTHYYGVFSTLSAWVMNIVFERDINTYPTKYKQLRYYHNPEEIRENLMMDIQIAFYKHTRNENTKYKPFILKIIYKEPYFQLIEESS